MKYLMKLGIPKCTMHIWRLTAAEGIGFTSATSTVNRALSKEILVRKGFYDLADAYQQCTSTIETAVYENVRTVV